MSAAIPTVSVIVPCYNGAATLAATLESIREQTLTAFEAIVVDDGSTDGSSAIALDFARRDPRFRLLVKENGGVATARNMGAATAKAEWLAFIDADDIWAPFTLDGLLHAANAAGTRPVLTFAWSRRIDDKDRVIADLGRTRFGADPWVHLVVSNFLRNASAAMIDRSAFEAVGGFDPDLFGAGAQGAEDLKLYLALAAHGKFACVPSYLVGYRVTPNAMSRTATRMRRSIEIVLSDLEAKNGQGRVRLFRYARCNYDLYAANVALSVRDWKLCAHYLASAIRRAPLLAVAAGTAAVAAKLTNALVLRPSARPLFLECAPERPAAPAWITDLVENVLYHATRRAVRDSGVVK